MKISVDASETMAPEVSYLLSFYLQVQGRPHISHSREEVYNAFWSGSLSREAETRKKFLRE